MDECILDMLADDHPATVRGTFYRVMSAGKAPKTENGYRLICRRVLYLRRSGRLDPDWITDGTRYVSRANTWRDLDELMAGVVAQYRRDIWRSQPVGVEVYVEKEALMGVLDPVTRSMQVPLGVLRGYSSETFTRNVAMNLETRKHTIMFQLGDHDPSGVDAWRNFTHKVAAFNPEASVEFHRLAVLPEQITKWGLPTRPTKRSDTRARSFLGGSVEVDAIPPKMLRSIVKTAIAGLIDWDLVEQTRALEAADKRQLEALIESTT